MEFRRFQEANGVESESNGFHEYPKCYSFIDDECHEAIFMEDLKELNFEMSDIRDRDVTYDHAHLVMSTLAKYHALSLALKHKKPAKFLELAEQCPEIFATAAKYFYDICEPLIYEVLNEDENNIREKLKKFFPQSTYTSLISRHTEAATEPCAILCHGDLKMSNIFFKYDEVVIRYLHNEIEIKFSSSNTEPQTS